MGEDQSSWISGACSIMHASMAPACCLTQRNAPLLFQIKTRFPFSERINPAGSVVHVLLWMHQQHQLVA